MANQVLEFPDPEMIVFPKGYTDITAQTIPATAKAVLFQNNNLITSLHIPKGIEVLVFMSSYRYGIRGIVPDGAVAYVCKGSITASHSALNQVKCELFERLPKETPQALLKRLYAESKGGSVKSTQTTDTTDRTLLTNERLDNLLSKSVRAHAEKIATDVISQIESDAEDSVLHLDKSYHLASFSTEGSANRMLAILAEFLPVDRIRIKCEASTYFICLTVSE